MSLLPQPWGLPQQANSSPRGVARRQSHLSPSPSRPAICGGRVCHPASCTFVFGCYPFPCQHSARSLTSKLRAAGLRTAGVVTPHPFPSQHSARSPASGLRAADLHTASGVTPEHSVTQQPSSLQETQEGKLLRAWVEEAGGFIHPDVILVSNAPCGSRHVGKSRCWPLRTPAVSC